MAFDLATAKPVSGGFDLSTAQPVGAQPRADNSQFDKGSIGSRAEDIASGANRFFTTILPGLPVDTVTNVVDLLKAGAGTAYHAATGNQIPTALELADRSKIPFSSANIQKNIDQYAPTLGENNRPVNNDMTGRVLHSVGIGAGGAIAGTGVAGGSIPAATNNALLSIAPSATQQVVAEKLPDSPLAQIAAGIGASALQGGARYAAPQLTKMMLRGGEEGRQNAQATIDQFAPTGETPTVGQATQSRTYQAAENMLAKVPGGTGPIITKAENLNENLGNKVNEIADNLSPSATPEQAGRAIYKGITGEHMKDSSQAFIPQARAVQQALYAKLDQHIDSAEPVSATNTVAALSKMVAPIEGAPNVSETPLMSNATLNSLNSAIGEDMGGSPAIKSALVDSSGNNFIKSEATAPTDKLPYQALKEMRTRVGEKLSDIDLAPDVSKGQLKQLYGALSQDMESAAKDAGPQAYAAFKRANGYTAAMHDRIDLLQSVIDKNGGPEKVFNAATSGTKDGATVLRAVMKSLPDDGQKMLSASILRRMGKALPGQQNDAGDVFSTNRFLTQWNTMSPEAKQAAFSRYGGDFSKNMDALAAVASNLRDGSKVFANPSGTAQALSQQTAILGILGALGTGHPVTAGAGVASIGAANLAARALTSPGVVKWMVKTTQLPINQLDAQIRLLAFTGQSKKDQDMIDIANALKEQRTNAKSQAN